MKKQILILAGAALAAVIPVQAQVSTQTIDNLNASYQGESNAANRYSAFAQKADAEGYIYAARLFRAAAKAESIHQERCRLALQSAGAKPKDFLPEAVSVGTTAENLQAAISGESNERDTLYPAYLKQAQAENARVAVRTFLYAQKAESEHARLFQEALANLGQNNDLTVYVCRVCGYTANALPGHCPSCRESLKDFIKID